VQVARSPDGKIVAELRIVKAGPDLGFSEVMIEARLRALEHPFTQFPQVYGRIDPAHARDQRAILDLKGRWGRRLGLRFGGGGRRGA